MKAKFCPGYHVARTCGGRCATCKHVVLRDLPPSGRLVMIQALCDCLDFPYPQRRRRGQRLPVAGRGTLELKKIRPRKKANAGGIAATGALSRTDVAKKWGRDFNDVADQLAAENQYLESLGLPTSAAVAAAETKG